MLIQSVGDIVNHNFNIEFLNAVQQFWRNTRYFQCIGEPKKQNLLLFLNGYEMTYTDKSGNTITAHSGDVVYTPVGSEYKVDIVRVGDDASHTIGINFHLFTQAGEDFVISDKLCVFEPSDQSRVELIFQRIASDEAEPSYLQKRTLLMQILNMIASDNTPPKSIALIAPALDYLATHLEEAPSVAALAKLCNISEGYFRRQFRTCMGKSPVEYRNELRLDKARLYLEYGDVSVQEISDMLGYATVSHFIKEFKNHNGIPPLKYRKKFRS